MGFLGSIFASHNDINQLPQQNYLPQINNQLSNQNQLAQTLMGQISGSGPNLANTQLQAGTDRAMKQAAALTGAQKGISPSTQLKNVAQNQAQINQGAANQASQNRAQEIYNSEGLLGQTTSNTLGQVGQMQQGQNQIQAQGQLANQQADNGFLGSLGGIGSAIATGGASLFSSAAPTGSFMAPEGTSGFAGSQFNGPAMNMPAYHAARGGDVPGEATQPGDHPDNDTVPAMLSPGEVVVPRSLTKKPHLDPEEVANFIAGFTGQKVKSSGYGRVAMARKKLDDAQ